MKNRGVYLMDYTEKIKKIEENILKSQEVINREQNKIKKYVFLCRRLKKNKRLTNVYTMPIVITINGLIHEKNTVVVSKATK